MQGEQRRSNRGRLSQTGRLSQRSKATAARSSMNARSSTATRDPLRPDWTALPTRQTHPVAIVDSSTAPPAPPMIPPPPPPPSEGPTPGELDELLATKSAFGVHLKQVAPPGRSPKTNW